MSWFASPRQEDSPSDPSLRPQIAAIVESSIRYRLDKGSPIMTHLRTPFQSRTSSLGNQEMLVHPLQGRKDASPVELERVPFECRVVVLVELSYEDYRLVNSDPSYPMAFRTHRWVNQNDSRELLRVDAVSHMFTSLARVNRFRCSLRLTHKYASTTWTASSHRSTRNAPAGRNVYRPSAKHERPW